MKVTLVMGAPPSIRILDGFPICFESIFRKMKDFYFSDQSAPVMNSRSYREKMIPKNWKVKSTRYGTMIYIAGCSNGIMVWGKRMRKHMLICIETESKKQKT